MIEHPGLIQKLFEKNLPPEVRANVDLNAIQPLKDSFLRDTLHKGITDFIFSVQFKGKEG
jgi:hypothetical protein